MRTLTIVVALVVPAIAQLPLPDALMEAETVYLTAGPGVDRKTLGHVASEFRKQRRFELVAEPAVADLIATLRRSSQSQGFGVVAIPNVGFVGAEEKRRFFSLDVTTRRTSRRVWADERPADWTIRGAVKDLVKDLHEEIRAVK